MEYNFRPKKDGQPPPYACQSSTFTYFTQQAMRAGYSNNNYGGTHEFFQNPNGMREVIQRELEKERIREEIIAEEIARRRVLEAEVRRELMMEQELALRRSDGFPFVSDRYRFNAHCPQPLPISHQPEGSSLEERIALSLEEKLGRQPSRGFEMVPFQARSGPQIAEIKHVPEVNEDKVILLGKPNTNITGVKRKAVTPPAVETSQLALVCSKKQSKDDWSCAICQVSATSERGLNEHLKGKKHKSKEAALVALKTGTNFGFGLLPKKTAAPIMPVETNSRPNSVSEKEVKLNVGAAAVKKKSPSPEEKPVLNLKKQTDASQSDDRKSKFKFWCEMCQVGAFSEKVMNNHRRGKKHTQLMGLKLSGGTVARITLPMAKKQSEDIDKEGNSMSKELVTVTLEAANKEKASEEIVQEEIKGASEKTEIVQKEAHLEVSQDITNTSDISN